MASSCNRFVSRASLSAVKSAIRANGRTASVNRSATPTSSPFPLPSRSTVSPLRRFSSSRTRGELGCIQSLLPLHSAVAAARMTSCLSSTSRSCKALSQDGIDELGLSVPR
ncbi:protein NUCLEAR FUSION DEFECTIVE 6, chloroplastic/mitochondrial-like isoform X1 [Vitis riparia]|uniref:protein NUCLEAR FUSION DEFECTIVE 6, chloroplastic/mitochondrial-like isoform X1 n=1 Tax=Vitis riparia TaxID=96939 RepID=UPI00155A12B0|nr:protein NUCLEAR FUSION DEFECTIVE 6, chloroplastic/mitochondrial-like isoform X1 [Vitis riparia]